MTSTSSNQAMLCPGCGAGLVFNPTLGQLACPYCDRTTELALEERAVEEQYFAEWSGSHTLTALSTQALEVKCTGCQAQVTFEPPDVAGDCPFCGTHLSAQVHSADPVVTPNGILPFEIGRKAAQQKLTRWLKTRWFAPSSLKTLAQCEKLQGVYLPFWTYDCQTATAYQGERGTYYYVTKTRQVKGDNGEWKTETYQERHTRWKSVSGHVSRFFDDVLVPAVQNVDLAHLNQFDSWPLANLVAYDPSYLRGFRAQRYQISLDDGFETAKSIMSGTIQSDIRHHIGGDEQRIHSSQTNYSDKTFKHLLMPVWMATYRFKNRPYQVLINGVSGNVVGDRPYSVFKIAFTFLTALAIGVLGYAYKQGNLQLPPLPSLQRPTITTTPAPNSTPTVPASPAPSPAITSDVILYDAFNTAMQAATRNQTAQTKAEWQQVMNLWMQAIEKLETVPEGDVNHEKAQQKIQEYQRNLNYARQRFEQAS